MQIKGVSLDNLDQLIVDYKTEKATIMDFFEYHPFKKSSYTQRLKDLNERTFKRKELSELLVEKNKEWHCSSQTLEKISHLEDEESVVVVGGQQAGLLTGPLYTMNKVISIIKFAQEQEEELGIPVIPLFWIAGEDHDYAEVNHTYILEENKPVKHTLKHHLHDQPSLTNIEKDDAALEEFIDELFGTFQETEFTKNLHEEITFAREAAKNYVDFFAILIHQLFADYGVVLIDSHDADVRKLESEYFNTFIKHQEGVNQATINAKQSLAQKGYSVALDVDEAGTNLFYELQNNRILLQRDGDFWTDKQEVVQLSMDDMINLAEDEPERLSNNVITRPMMQEFLFPTLAFIGGNGEIAYWSVLKNAFAELGLKMPPVLPRLSFTYIDNKMVSVSKALQVSIEDCLKNVLVTYKLNWLKNQTSPAVPELFASFSEILKMAHEPIQEQAEKIRSDLGSLTKKNLEKIENEMSYLEERFTKVIKEKNASELAKYDFLNSMVNPNGGLQERIWSPYLILNEFGTSFIKELMKEQLSFKTDHYLVYL